MEASRRDCLKLGLLATAGSLAGCSIVSNRVGRMERSNLPPPKVASTEEERVLNRAGFGPSAATLASYRELGKDSYIDRQLKADESEDLSLLLQLQPLDVLQLEPSDLWDLPFETILSQLRQAAILQSVYSRNQLRERMIDFWSNHFNIYGRKGNTGYSKGVEEYRVIRPNALGSFPEMLKAMAHSPAMLEFLDNQRNNKGVANENYARELMELHTLGLHGGYTQKDVQEVARCFTGWTIETRFLRPKGHFRFDEERHDSGPKTVLGHNIAAGGMQNDAEQVLEILAKHPATARFISTKLSSYFLGELDEKWVDLMSAEYLRTNGNIAEVLRPLLHSKAMLDSPLILKRPFDYMVSALRITEAETDGGAPVQRYLEIMGEPLYQWPMPDGYPVKASSWTSSLLPRWNFAAALTSSSITRTSCSPSVLEKGVGALPIRCASKVSDTPIDLRHGEVALCLASPDFQWR